MWWGLRCALTFLGDLLLSDGMGDPGIQWTVEKRFRVTEVFLAILWVRGAATLTGCDSMMSKANRYGSVSRRRIFHISSLIVSCPGGQIESSLSVDILLSRLTEEYRLVFYTPSATVVRLLTTNALIAYITNCVLYLSGASQDPRMLLPAWVSIATVQLLRQYGGV